MKTIQSKLLALLVVLIFFACSGAKRATVKTSDKSEIKTETAVTRTAETTADVKVTDKSETLTDKSLTQVENESNELEQRITLYDTDKGIVPGTTLPPVKSVTITTHKKKATNTATQTENKKQLNNKDSSAVTTLKSQLAALQKQNASLISKTTTKEQPPNPWWKWFLAGIVIPPILYGLWWLRKWVLKFPM